MGIDATPLAFVYDRHATKNREILRLRLEVCVEYAIVRDWDIGGYWADLGDGALTAHHRPAFEAMLNAIGATGTDTPRVCLLNGWDRLSHDRGVRDLLTRRVLHLGAWVETCLGEQLKPNSAWRQEVYEKDLRGVDPRRYTGHSSAGSLLP